MKLLALLYILTLLAFVGCFFHGCTIEVRQVTETTLTIPVIDKPFNPEPRVTLREVETL